MKTSQCPHFTNTARLRTRILRLNMEEMGGDTYTQRTTWFHAVSCQTWPWTCSYTFSKVFGAVLCMHLKGGSLCETSLHSLWCSLFLCLLMKVVFCRYRFDAYCQTFSFFGTNGNSLTATLTKTIQKQTTRKCSKIVFSFLIFILFMLFFSYLAFY